MVIALILFDAPKGHGALLHLLIVVNQGQSAGTYVPDGTIS